MQDILLKTVSQLRFRLEAHNIPRFHLEITASGETDDIGCTLIEWKLSKDAYTDIVRGNDLHSVTDEFVRRYGWQKKHSAELLPNRTRHDELIDEDQAILNSLSDEVPF